jgi:hypothetical protein
MSASNRVNQIAGHLNYPKGMLAGQVAIITGSGQGIGAEAARLFANEGAKVVVADVDASKCRASTARTHLTQHREGAIRRRRDQRKRRQRHRSLRRRARRRLHQDTHPESGRVWQWQDPHHRQQCRLHLGRRHPQDDGQAMAHDCRPARDCTLQDCARGGAVLPRQGRGAEEHYQHLEHVGCEWQCWADQLRTGEGGCDWHDKDDCEGVCSSTPVSPRSNTCADGVLSLVCAQTQLHLDTSRRD